MNDRTTRQHFWVVFTLFYLSPLWSSLPLQPLHWNNPWNHPRDLVSTVNSCSSLQSRGCRCTKGKGKVNRCSGFLFLHSYTCCNLILTVRGCRGSVTKWNGGGGEMARAPPPPLPSPRLPSAVDPAWALTNSGRKGGGKGRARGFRFTPSPFTRLIWGGVGNRNARAPPYPTPESFPDGTF